jgi:hypothetical protein
MPTAQTNSAGAAKTPGATTAKSSAAKRAGTKSAGARKSANAKRASSARSNASSSRSTAAVKDSSLGAYAERAVLIPVGAALIARERVLAGVNDTIAHYNSTAKASAQLRRFERRGNTARNRVERELRKTRVRVERELRQTRTRVEREVTRRRRDGEALAERVQERIQSLV